MMLGAISPINTGVSPQPLNVSSAASQPATTSTIPSSTSSTPDVMDTLKKYAPYIIAGIVLLYIIKNK